MKTDVLMDAFFKELTLPERVAEIADCGYSYVETWGGGDSEQLREIAEAGADCDVKLVSIVMNSPSDDTIAPVRKEHRQAFLERIDSYSDNALEAGCCAGIVTTGSSVEGMSADEHVRNLTEALAEAGMLAAEKGFTLNLEPLNTAVDHAGYFLDSRETGAEIVRNVNMPSVKLLYDIYHMEIMHGSQVDFIEKNIDIIGHFHSAGVSGRHEPFCGETNYPFVLEKIENAGYDGYFGLEYMPTLEDAESLRKTAEYFSQIPFGS